MELLSPSDAATRLGVTLDTVRKMVADGTLLAVRFAFGVKVLLDDDGDRDRGRHADAEDVGPE